MRSLGRFLLGAVLCALIVLSALWFWARPGAVEPFFTTLRLPDNAAPGSLIASEVYTRDVPDGARAWRIAYVTRRLDGQPTVATAVVMVPEGAGPFPVINWAHGTIGIVAGCAPSSLAPFANVPALPELLAQGWAYVATDYPGLGTEGGHAYLVGREAGQAVLDAARAARNLPEVRLSDQNVIWGHSQGGGAALWAALLAADYAPDLRIAGVAAFAPASDLPKLLQAAQRTTFGKIVSAYLITGYAQAYPDVRRADYMGAVTSAVAGDIAGRCVDGLKTLVSVAETALLPGAGMFRTDPNAGALGQRLQENVPKGPFPMPVMIAQGRDDDLVLAPLQADYARMLCAGGDTVDFEVYEGLDHISLVAPSSALTAPLLDWTRARLSGAPARGCASPTD